jgi:lycopene cyclase domain-containing protein
MKYTYLLINLFAVIVPFIFSFHPGIRFNKTWKAFFPSVMICSAIFLSWDSYFTDRGVWGFNDDYLSGVYILNLPLEEILFFICIPFACVFTYHTLNIYIGKPILLKLKYHISFLLIITLLTTGIVNLSRLYTSVTFISLAILIAITLFIIKFEKLGNFYLIYLILLIPFFIINGILTGTGTDNPVVWYNNSENLGIRLLTIPVEDVFYGMELILLNVLFYEYFLNRNNESLN